MKRLFSTFARGWPGVGLLVLRLVAAIALLQQATMRLPAEQSIQSHLFAILTGAVALLLLAGLWTPIGGALTLLIELRNILAGADSPRICILLGVFGVAIAMIGPGAWSIDARRYGWKRIDPRDR